MELTNANIVLGVFIAGLFACLVLIFAEPVDTTHCEERMSREACLHALYP